MCGRYFRRSDKQFIAEHFHARTLPEAVFQLTPSYNVAPATFQPVIRNAEDGEREITLMRWGLVPFWSKTSKAEFTTINARAETVTKSPVFRDAFKRRHCLVIADGFYEWKKLDAKDKQPYAFGMAQGEPFAFAGLWEIWKNDTEQLETYTIITTEPNELTATVHNRMPVILRPEDYDRWLAPSDPERPPIDLLRPYDADKMRAWPVHKDVGNVRNNHPELLNSA